MLKHTHPKDIAPKRVVILGAKGFIGSTIAQQLEAKNVPVVKVSRAQIDFCSDNAPKAIADVLQADDTVVIAAAKAPVKNNQMLLDNINMMNNICAALEQQPVAHVLYISSDAVYGDSMEPLNEASPTAPTSLHGVMHSARELMLGSILDAEKLVCVRPTLVYGANDPHNGYGPNQFYRLVKDGQPIKLFGQGEEQRDHVHVEDVAEIAVRCLLRGSHGVINAVTGNTISFFDIAKKMQAIAGKPVEIKHLERKGPMPHNGYRAFDNAVSQKAFPDFQYKASDAGFQAVHQAATFEGK